MDNEQMSRDQRDDVIDGVATRCERLSDEELLRLRRLLTEDQHIVMFHDDGWLVAHPLRERLDGSFFSCRTNWKGGYVEVRGKFILIDERTYGAEVTYE